MGHAEYVKLLRSAHDGQVFDLVTAAAERYLSPRRPRLCTLELWKFNRRICSIRAGQTVRVQASAPFRLRWSDDDWRTAREDASVPTGLGPEYFDIATLPGQKAPLRFTFYWRQTHHWEGEDFEIAVGPALS